ncbi:PREDICTED: uncharacterized protein LOC109463600 [Branchiostoma belcheri]|uniref:Uncharacterized protein LOC109463600 n=1 Tax=Branchiostoma belcheri TaxID=7741 RepID=A0A6P4YG81_BRABE|nr:PREDICTED: uncharacterized protein LOC109463600 [Branchiostoma belcheri]
MANQEGKTGSPQKTVSYKTEQSTKPGGLCRLRLPLLVLAVLLTAGVARGQAMGEFKGDDEKVAVKAPGHNICYIVDKSPVVGHRFVIAVDESRSARPDLGEELAAFCGDLEPRWATADLPGEGGGSANDVMVQIHHKIFPIGSSEEEEEE